MHRGLTAGGSGWILAALAVPQKSEWKGSLGSGAHSRMHTAEIRRLSEDLPVVIEIVDAAEKIEAFVRERLDEMVQEGLVTVEGAEAIMYRGPDKRRE